MNPIRTTPTLRIARDSNLVIRLTQKSFSIGQRVLTDLTVRQVKINM